MDKFVEISPKDFNYSPFNLIGNDWMLITAKKDDSVNTMTASWGGLGVIWGKNVAYVVIRPQRYTKEFVDFSDSFSLTFFDESLKKELAYLGKVSGRDENKIEKAGLTVIEENGVPIFKEAKMALLCRKLYAQEMKPECFVDKSCDEIWYPQKDYHTLYVAEIQKILIKD